MCPGGQQPGQPAGPQMRMRSSPLLLAELLNSSLEKYPSLTVCARFLTHHFSPHREGPPQALLSYGRDDLLSSFVAMSCEGSYSGCTQEYRDMLSEKQVQWMSGKVFGYFSISDSPHFYPAWRPAVWNTACLTASPGRGHYGLNINGLTVLEIQNFTSNLFSRDKVR